MDITKDLVRKALNNKILKAHMINEATSEIVNTHTNERNEIPKQESMKWHKLQPKVISVIKRKEILEGLRKEREKATRKKKMEELAIMKKNFPNNKKIQA
jgi:hypothetical protein